MYTKLKQTTPLEKYEEFISEVSHRLFIIGFQSAQGDLHFADYCSQLFSLFGALDR